MNQVAILSDLAVIFSVSVVVVLILHRLRLPALPGFIVAGVLVGPHGLGLVGEPHAVETLAEVGVILLLFTVGIEFSLEQLRRMHGRALATAGLQVGVTIACTALATRVIVGTWPVAVFLGCLAALSSTALVLKGLTDRGAIDAPYGRLATTILILQDLSVVPMVLAVPFLAGQGAGGPVGIALTVVKAVAIVVGALFAARTLVPRVLAAILGTRSRELFLIAVILLGILTAFATAAAGASLALGAFLAGLVVSESDYGHQAMADLIPFRDVFLSLFFVSVGMLVRLDYILEHPVLTLGGTVLVLAGKSVITAVVAGGVGTAARVALTTALSLSQIGEFSLVLAAQGRAMGLLDEATYQPVLTIAALTMLVTPFLLELGPGLAERMESGIRRLRWLPLPGEGVPSASAEPIADHVIIAGYGLNGRNLATALRAIAVPHLIVELNARAVREARARGEPAFYGDATREEILRGLAIDRARLFVVAISDAAATRRIVRLARRLNPRLYIIARTRYVAELAELARLGADVVIPEEFETSLEIFARVLHHYGAGREEIDRLTHEIRSAHYAALRSASAPAFTSTLELPQMRIERIALRPETFAVGKSLAHTGLRSRTGALVLSIRRDGADLVTPDPRRPLQAGDVLAVVGQPPQLAAAHRLLEHGPE